MKFTEKQLEFFKKNNIEATEENYRQARAYYLKNIAKTLTDSDLEEVSGGTGYSTDESWSNYDWSGYDPDIFPAIPDPGSVTLA